MTALHPVPGFEGPGCLWHLPAEQATRRPILMTHGTFSTAETLAPLAAYFAARGHDVFIIEWRGRTGPPGRFDLHDLAEGELTSALTAMAGPVHVLAHSGGGLGWCFALLDPAARARAQSLTLLATQGTHLREAARLPYLGVCMAEIMGRARGYWAAHRFGLGPVNETAALLSQWVRFNRAGRISLRDGSDLLPRLAALNLPVLALAGAGDHLIARPEGCAHLARAFGPSAQVHLCDAASDGEDFTHSRLIRSRAAARSVWPRIAAFLDAQDTSG